MDCSSYRPSEIGYILVFQLSSLNATISELRVTLDETFFFVELEPSIIIEVKLDLKMGLGPKSKTF